MCKKRAKRADTHPRVTETKLPATKSLRLRGWENSRLADGREVMMSEKEKQKAARKRELGGAKL